MSETEKITTPLIVLSVVLTASIFLLDLSLPLGVAGGVPYVLVVLASLWLPRQRDTVIVATVCTVLTIVGFYLSASGSVLWIVITNRSLAVFAIWTTAILSLNRKRSQEELRDHRDHLDKLVAERTAEVQESEERLRLLFDSTHDLITLCDEKASVLWANAAWEDVFGQVSDRNLDTFSLIHADDLKRVGEAWSAFLDSETEIRDIESRLRLPSGEYGLFQSAAYPVRIGGEQRYFIVACDITDQRRAEEDREKLEAQLRQAQKMEAVGQLAGGVAHDFNNLLQAILGYSDLALDEAGADSPARASIEEMRDAGHRAKTLVSQLLAFSRRQVLEMQDVNMNDVCVDLMKMLRRVIGEHITLDMYAGHDLGIVRVDRGQIEQILMNLCVNARDAMPDGGTITIETENVRFDETYCKTHAWAKVGRYVLLSVTDTGCGMDGETLGKAFEPFFTTKGVGEGTGLGLSTVYGLVRQHQGMIHAYSEIGEGTTFKIYLPLVERSVTAVGDKIEGSVPGGTETILLAEDEEMVRNLTKAILERAGYTLLTACDGEEALRVFEEKVDKIDLALLDVMMPNLGGRAVFERIRETTQEVRVLFTSGYSMNAVHTNFVLDQDVALIQKPYLRDALLRKVRDVLDS